METLQRDPTSVWAVYWWSLAYNSLLTLNEKIDIIETSWWATVSVWFSGATYLCDWVSDNVQIQEAINYLTSLGWGKLKIKKGNYSISSTITVLCNNITIEWEWASTLLTLANWINSHIFKVWDWVTTYQNITFRDLQLDWNIANQVQQATPMGGISIYLCKYCTVDNVIANNCLDFGIGLWYGEGCKNRIINCTTNDCWWDGIWITNSGENYVGWCGAKWNGHWGIIVKDSLFCSLVWNVFNNNSTWIVIKYSNRISIIWNQCSWNQWGSGIWIITADECTITGNICHWNSYIGIRMDGGRRNTIAWNTCNWNSSEPWQEWLWAGIEVFKSESLNYSTHNIVLWNTCCDWKWVPTQKYWYNEGSSNDDYNVVKSNYFYGNTIGWASLKWINSIESDNNKHSDVANFWNYKLVPSVSSNNLTLSIKNWEWNDATPWKPILYKDWNGEIRTITSALSVTANAWTDHLNAGRTGLATKQVDFFPYFQWNTTTESTNLLIRRFPEASTMADIVNSWTNEKGAIWIVNYNLTDTLINIGRFSAILWVSATYLWTLWTDIKHKPTNESRWLDFGTVFTGFSSPPTNIFSSYKVIGDTCIYRPHSNTNGTSNTTAMTITAPFKAFDTGSSHWTWSFMAVDNGAFQTNPWCLYYSAVNNYIEVYKTWAFGAWTAALWKNVKDWMITYKI